jgi:ketosteroid isomerase-like protein
MEKKRQAAGQIDADTAIDLANSFSDAWNRHDVEALAAMFHPQGTLTTPAFPTPLSGKPLQGYLQEQLADFPDIKAEPIGDKLLGMNIISGRYLITGTWTKAMTAGPLASMAPTGKSFKMHSADFLEIMDGKIAAWTQYYDRMALLTQLAIIPPR